MNYIYTLCDPRDYEVRYVGKTNNPDLRFKMHLKDKDVCHRTHWIQELIKCGLKPILIIIEQIPDGQDWENRERYWIKHYRDIGCKLTNGTDGGDAGPPRRKGQKPKSTVNYGKFWTGRKHSELSKIKISAGNTGKKDAPKRIEQKRQWMTGRKHHTEAFKRQLAQRNKTRQYDDAARQVMRENSRKLWDDPVKGPELRARLAERNRRNKWRHKSQSK